MDQTLASYFLTQGPWAALFVWLLYTTKKEAREREQELHGILNKFSEKYDVIIDELQDIKAKVSE